MTERIRVETLGVFAFYFSFIIYPLAACWCWNPNGWLTIRGYHDFAGSSVVHLLGGTCGLMGCLMVGPRINRFKNVQLPFIFGKAR